LLYDEGQAIAWCSVAPRSVFASLNRSPVLKPIDDVEVWSIVCFFVRKSHRNQGILIELIRSAIRYVESRGGAMLEAYPTIIRGEEVAPVSAYMGFPENFKEAGFVEVRQASKAKLFMRYAIGVNEGEMQPS
jgi:hypothetical protein